MTALVFDGIEHLLKNMQPKKDLLMEWFEQSWAIEAQNEITNKDLLSLLSFISEKRLMYSLLKVKAVLLFILDSLIVNVMI